MSQDFLSQVIRSYGGAMQNVVGSYLEQSLKMLSTQQQQIRDEAMTIFLAGHETTANALTWTWYLLSRHPHVETRLHAEIDSALGGRAASVDDMSALPYTRMVLAESMRLYPPAWIVGRRAMGPFQANGYTIPARSIVLMSQYTMHHDARWFPDPERFDPDRMLGGTPGPTTWLPFGGGGRRCLGATFALIEMRVVIREILRRVRLDTTTAPDERQVTKHVTLVPHKGARIRVSSLTSAPAGA